MEKEYYIHITNEADETKIKNIFTMGLRCNYGSPYYTIRHHGSTINETLLDLYTDNDKTTFIIAVPRKYLIVEDSEEYPELVHAETDAFMYYPKGETVPYVRPEFVYGCYNHNLKNYIYNENFYDNLTPDKKDDLMHKTELEYNSIFERIEETNTKSI